MCEEHEKLSYRSYSAACAAAHHYFAKRNTPLRVYYDSQCSTYHVSSKISLSDHVGVAS